jgi:photosystem II stability/assembly factor-like uncharacterized protein
MNPQNPDQLWIGTWSNGVLRSNDLGRTWTAANTGLQSGGATLQRTSVSVCAGTPSVLYTLAHERMGTRDVTRIYRSNDGGDSWSLAFNSETTGNNFLGNAVQSQGWYNNVIQVKDNDPNVVVAGGVTMVRSSNGGASWSSVGGNVHADHHAFAVDPANPNTIYNGNDGGMYRSEDGGASYTKISNGLAINQFYAIAVDQRAEDISYGGTQDNGTFSITSSSAQRIAGGDGFYVVVDHSNSDIIYGEYPNGDLWKLNRGTGQQFPDINGGLFGEAQWSAPILMDPVDPNVLYHGRQQLFVTVDGGNDWQAVSPQVAGQISAIGVSKVNRDIIYVGSNRGTLLVSRDGGQTWNDYTFSGGVPNRYIADFAPALKSEAVCYVSVAGFFSGHVFKTTNYGETWTDVSSNLPDIPVNALAIHPDDDNVLYAGTDLGVFVTVDGGANWMTYMNGLPRTEVLDMEVHTANSELRIATYGRSMWSIELERPVSPPSISSPIGGEVWTVGSAHVLGWSGFDGAVNVELSTDDGQTWAPLAQNVAGGLMRWNVQNRPTMWARIRVTSVGDPTRTATSHSFTIEAPRIGGLVQQTSKPITPYGLAFDGQFLYTVNFYGYQMLKIDPVTLQTVEVITLDTEHRGSDSSMFTDLAYHPERGTIYMHRLASINGGGGFLYEFTKTGQQVNRWQSPAGYPIGLAWMGADNPELPYMLATDRDGNQQIFLIDATNGEVIITLERERKVNLGPRGATSAGPGQSFYQVITNFAGNSLTEATAELMAVENQTPTCTIPLADPGGLMNARGIEFDPADRNVWVSDFDGNIYKVVTCQGLEEPTGATPETGLAGFALSQNTPNPFRGETEIAFMLPKSASAQIRVHDANGRIVATLADGRYEAGTHRVRFAPTDLPSGVYRYTLVVDGSASLSRSMVYVR